MSVMTFRRCVICGVLFWHKGRTTYCTKCIPYVPLMHKTEDMQALKHLREKEKERERERWKLRMSNPAFREKERLRSRLRSKVKK